MVAPVCSGATTMAAGSHRTCAAQAQRVSPPSFFQKSAMCLLFSSPGWARPTRGHLSSAALLIAGYALAAQPAAAAGPRAGAYTNELGTVQMVCVTAEHLAQATATAWHKAMQERGMECTISASDRPMAGHETWKAQCSPTAPNTTAGTPHHYQFSVHSDGERLVIDSGMKNANGQQVMKKAFFGHYKGACTPDMPPLDVNAYLNGIYGMLTVAQADTRKAVALDLIRCANVFNGLSLSVTKARQEGLRTAAAALLEAAVELHPGDGDFHLDALKRSAPEVSAELVGAPADKKFALYQSCSPYLEQDGIAQAVQKREAGKGAGATTTRP
jgi:hypothetical protein